MRPLLIVVLSGFVLACPGDDPPVSPSDVEDGDLIDTSTDAPVVPDECDVRADCVPLLGLPPCLDVACVAGRCELGDLPDGAACDDGDPCTTGGGCQAGACVSEPACDDGNPCTTDGCDPNLGCIHTFNQRPCDDGSVCTTGDRCFMGECVGTPLDCDDQNQCTVSVCDPELGCVHTQRQGPCDDGNACTVGDACQAGVCVPGGPAVCGDPGNPCQSATCDPVTGCHVEIVSGPCDDGNACTEDDICMEGVCVGTLVTCDDGNPCTDDYCDPALGCTSTPNVAPCDDGDPCTVGDTCADGVCQPGTANPLCCGDAADCDPGDACELASCVGGLCVFTPLSCDDGLVCTLDRCDEGACVNEPWGIIPEGPAVVADFAEATALDGWLLASTNDVVGWQRDTSRSRSGGASLYCGAIPAYSYDFGATLAQATLHLDVPPGSQATLRFWAQMDVEENVSCTFDVLRLLVDGAPLPNPICGSLPAWTERTVDLSAYLGRRVALTFEFDTVDDQANDGEGVWIDDITLEVTDPPPCCEPGSACTDEDDGCLTPLCEAATLMCAIPDGAVACDDDDPCTEGVCDPLGECAQVDICP